MKTFYYADSYNPNLTNKLQKSKIKTLEVRPPADLIFRKINKINV